MADERAILAYQNALQILAQKRRDIREMMSITDEGTDQWEYLSGWLGNVEAKISTTLTMLMDLS